MTYKESLHAALLLHKPFSSAETENTAQMQNTAHCMTGHPVLRNWNEDHPDSYLGPMEDH